MGDPLLDRLAAGPLICGQGYVFELERRGYLQAGPFVPEVVLDHPEVVQRLHEDLVHAGSDVVEALTYYAHRAKLRSVSREAQIAELNQRALSLARDVARRHDALFAGDICNTNVYEPDDPDTHRAIRAMFDEQLAWALDAGVDYVIAETFTWLGEAEIALDAVRATGKSAVVTLAIADDGRSWDGCEIEECGQRLEDGGAAVVGLNCFRGPRTLLPLAKRLRETVSCEVAALPVPYRTTERRPTFYALRDDEALLPEGRPFPTALDPFTCNRYEMAAFAKDAHALGIRYIGGCCGTGPHHVRAMAEALGRRPPASRYSADVDGRKSLFGENQED